VLGTRFLVLSFVLIEINPFPEDMLYFRISVTNILILSNDSYPLSNFPQGGKVWFLPLWGKARLGVSMNTIKVISMLKLRTAT
jgi:hypothetical protein